MGTIGPITTTIWIHLSLSALALQVWLRFSSRSPAACFSRARDTHLPLRQILRCRSGFLLRPFGLHLEVTSLAHGPQNGSSCQRPVRDPQIPLALGRGC